MTALVADDLGPVLGLGAVTREVTFLIAIVAGDICSRTRLGTFASHVSGVVAVLANDDSGVGALVLAVAMVVLSGMQTHLDVRYAYPTSPQLKQAPVFFLGSGHSLDM